MNLVRSSMRLLSLVLPIASIIACSSGSNLPGGEQDAGLADAEAEVLPDAENPDVCGDGTVGSTETCDDGARENDDGCNSDCEVEAGYACENDPSVCAPVCGDSTIIAPEECDDGDAIAGDGCSDVCVVEMGFSCPTAGADCVALDGSCALPFELLLADNAGTLEGTIAGDTSSEADQVPATLCDGAIVGAGPDLIYSFSLPDARDVTISAMFATDGLFRVLTTPCDPLTAAAGETAFGDACANQAALGENESLTLLNLEAGTYFIAVDGALGADEGMFSLTVSAVATSCGDGIIDAAEECDDNNAMPGDGCTSCTLDPLTTCSGIPSVCVSTCQNGIVDTATLEECDDGNIVDDDRCSNLCGLNADVVDTEDNNSFVTAQALASGQVARGSLDPLGSDVFDLYTFTLAAQSWVLLEQYSTVDGDPLNYAGPGSDTSLDCDVDPQLRIFDAGGDPTDDATSILFDDDDGDGFCPYLGANNDGPNVLLDAGTYYIKINEFDDDDAMPLYALDFQTQTPLVLGDGCDTAFDLCGTLLGCNTATNLCELLCGDGVIDASEECDDNNGTDDDRCSNTCLLNADVVDTEDNNSFATAQPLASGEVARGSLDPNGGDVFDLYTFTLAAPSWVTLEEYNTVDGDIANYDGLGSDNTLDCNSDQQVRIFDSIGDPNDDASAIVFNDDEGDGLCGYLGANNDGADVFLPQGTYFVKVNEFLNNDAVPLYALDFQVSAGLGNGDICDTAFDLCTPALVCEVASNTCRLPAPPSIDRTNFEQFATGEFDLSNTTLVFSPAGTSYGVVATVGTIAYPDTVGAGTISATTLSLGDDSNTEVVLTVPFSFFGVNESSVFVSSNGRLTFGVGSSLRNESASAHFAIPSIAFFFDDLNPSASGVVTVDEYADHTTITFDDVPAFGSPNTIAVQVQLFDDSTIVITYLAVSETDCLVGLSAGDNEGNPPVALDFSAQIPVAPVAGDLVINEVLGNAAGVDSNCDGLMSSTGDEFIELVNISGVPLDLSGVTISDLVQVRHTFGATVLAHGQAIVVYGSGTSLCQNVTGEVASTGNLGLNNGGDTITLNTTDSMTYGSSSAGISTTLSVELVGPDYVEHNQAAGAVSNFSPGFRVTGETF